MIRQLQTEDIQELQELMKQEDTKLELNEMFPANTYVWIGDGIQGFFHFRIEQNCPSLRHFLIKKKYRNIRNARMLLKEYFKIIKDFKYSIISVEKPYLMKLIEYKFKKKPYASNGKLQAYLVEA